MMPAPLEKASALLMFIPQPASTPEIVANSAGRSAVSSVRTKRSEEHTSELQSRLHLVCRLLLEKKKHIGRTPRVRPPALEDDIHSLARRRVAAINILQRFECLRSRHVRLWHDGSSFERILPQHE